MRTIPNLKFGFTLFFILFIGRLAAQTYHPFPTGSASWKVVRCFYFYQPGWHDEYTFIMDGSDTIHNGLSFKKINISKHHAPGTAYDSIYPTEFFGGLRESSKQIFIWKTWASTDTSVTLVYDFNHTNVGDTIYTNALTGNPNSFGHLITGKDSVLVGTQYHKRLHLQDPSNASHTEDWIEGIGSSWGLPFATYWSATDNSYDLTCFYQEQQLRYGNPSPGYGYCQPPLPVINCEPVITSVKEVTTDFNFTIFPNPAFKNISITCSFPDRFKKGDLVIYNVYGVEIKRYKLNANFSDLLINTSEFAPGTYLYKVITSPKESRTKKLIIE